MVALYRCHHNSIKKVLPMITTQEKLILPAKERKALRSDYGKFKKWNQLWNSSKMNSRKNVGALMDIIVSMNPKSFQEWQDNYIATQTPVERFKSLGEKWAGISGLDFVTAVNHVFIHTIDETWEGWERENSVIKALEKQFPEKKFFRPDYKYDVDYGIDIAIENIDNTEHGFTHCLQIKPASFFAGKNANSSYYRNILANQHKMAEGEGLLPYFVNAKEILDGEFKYYHWRDILAL